MLNFSFGASIKLALPSWSSRGAGVFLSRQRLTPRHPSNCVSHYFSLGRAMELFRAEKVGEIESNSIKKCPSCNQKLELVRTILFATGDLIRLYECNCGARIWEE